MLTAAYRWIDHNILKLGRELRLSYLPPLMVYMAALRPAEAWFVLSTLLVPVGDVTRDAVADAMNVEAVPRVDAKGAPIDTATCTSWRS